MKYLNYQKRQYPKWILIAISALILLVGLGWLFLTKTGGSTTLIFGLSLLRLIACILILITVLELAFLIYQEIENPNRTDSNLDRLLTKLSNRGFLIGIFFIGYLSLGVFLYPPDQKAFYNNALERLKPVFFIIIGLAFNFIIWSVLNSFPFRINVIKNYLHTNKWQYISTVIVFLIFILVWILISTTRLGIQPDMYWQVVGVPFITFQLYLIGGYLIIFLLTTRYILKPILSRIAIKPTTLHLLIFLMIWLIASVTWLSTPQKDSVFAPGPYPPSFVFFPHSDAAVHDAGGVMMTLGLPLNNSMFTDKPAYMFFLGLLHLFFGDDPIRIMQVQTILLALFPAVLYLIGKEIYDWNLGLFIAMITIAREDNAISLVSKITTISVKETMSEIPLALTLALLCLLVIKYLKNSGKEVYPIYIGGVLGISILIRPHPLLFAPFLIIIFFILHWKRKRVLLKHLAFFLTPLLLVLVPISISNIQHGRNPDFLEKINIVLFQRGNIQLETNQITDSHDKLLIKIPYPNSLSPTTQAKPASGAIPPSPDESIIQNKVSRFATHFLHNEIAIILSLPSSFILYNDDQTIATAYWTENPVWNGKLSTGQTLSVLLGLIAISFGLARFMVKGKLTGLVPLLLHLIINISNSIARSSGGRFLVPADWIIYLYYAVGLFEILLFISTCFGRLSKIFSAGNTTWNSRSDSELSNGSGSKNKWGGQMAAMSLFLFYGLTLANLYLIIPMKYPMNFNAAQVLEQYNAYTYADATIPDLQGVLQNPDTRSIYGKALYPRFYKAGEGEPSPNSALYKQPFSRLTFEVLSPSGIANVVLPGSVKGRKLINGSSVLVLGCESGTNNFDALYIIILGKNENNILIRNSNQPYMCKK
jgi:hypothetical protein